MLSGIAPVLFTRAGRREPPLRLPMSLTLGIVMYRCSPVSSVFRQLGKQLVRLTEKPRRPPVNSTLSSQLHEQIL
jgi:hypothetical protein